MPPDRVPEAVLSRIWNEGWHSRELRTTDGRRVGVVYRGVWTHSNGPDFRDAMLDIDGKLVQGAVELHIRESDWVAHEHHLDPAYDAVVLHVVLEHDLPQAAGRPSGAALPTVAIGPFLHGPLDQFMPTALPLDLGDLGQRACLPTLADDRPEEIHRVLRREGWRRLAEKQLRFQQELVVRPAGEVLYRGMLDSLGLTSNRSGMERVADLLPLGLAERIASERGLAGLSAALLGVGGFLPLSPMHQGLVTEQGLDVSTVEDAWREIALEYALSSVPQSAWSLNRVRPLNHPARRLASMAWLLDVAADDGLFSYLLRLPHDHGTSWDLWLAGAHPAIGESRRRQIIVNTLSPFVAAYADVTDDQTLGEYTAEVWEQLPGVVDDDIARKTIKQIAGARRFTVRSALEIQGLHHIGRQGCAQLRCFECPIAALAVRFEEIQFSV